jgi:hypothetical protein
MITFEGAGTFWFIIIIIIIIIELNWIIIIMLSYNYTKYWLKAIGHLPIQVMLATLSTKIALDKIQICSYWNPDVILS